MQTVQKNEVKPFDFDTRQLRTILIENQIYFIAKDVCEILGIGRPDNATRYLHESQTILRLLDVGTKRVNMLLLNESGLYALLFKSRKPEAQKFQLWVTSEVLPSIRKSGVYSATTVAGKQLSMFAEDAAHTRLLQQLTVDVALRCKAGTPEYRLVKALKSVLFEQGGAAL